MKTEECRKIIDSIVFSNPEVKELVDKGWIKPESIIESNYMVEGQFCIKYSYRFFGGNYWFDVTVLNRANDSKFVCGWDIDNPDALNKAANNVIYELTHNCSLKYKEEYDDAVNECYSAPYLEGRYNED